MRVLNRERHVRQLVPRQCPHCGAKFFQHKGDKPRQFCSNKCKQADYRATRLEGQNDGYRNGPHHPTRVTITPPKTPVDSVVSKPTSGDRPSLTEAIQIEIIEPHEWHTVTSPDGVTCQVARWRPAVAPVDGERLQHYRQQIPDDLSIPAFLKRSQQ
jgi:hypothetical protein